MHNFALKILLTLHNLHVFYPLVGHENELILEALGWFFFLVNESSLISLENITFYKL